MGKTVSSKGVGPSKILIRGVNWLGDAVMSIPALLRLREKEPEARITLLCHQKLADLWLNHEAIDRVITFAAGESPWSVAKRLRPENFQTALILPNSPRSALEAWLAGIPQRIGYSRAWGNIFLTRAVPPRTGRVRMRKRSVSEIRRLVGESPTAGPERFPEAAHQSFDYLHLVAQLGATESAIAPRLKVGSEEVAAVREKFSLPTIGKSLFGLNPGAEYGPAKCWPIESFIAAAVEIQKQTNCRWLIFGTAAQATVAEMICGKISAHFSLDQSQPPLNLAGKTSLRELCALLSLCRGLLTNDSGPMHAASALGTPVVVPFGSTTPDLTGPWMKEKHNHLLIGQAPCAPCFRRECPIDFRCMKSISVESVVDAFLSLPVS